MILTQRRRLNIWGIAVLMIAAVSLLLTASHTFAVTAPTTANTLKVSPVRTDVTIEPGQSKTVESTVTNLTQGEITVNVIENDFVAGDERGTPSLILNADQYAPTHSLKRFMTPIPDITIPAGQSKTVEVVITVPKDAQAGGYFGAVRFAPGSADSGGQVNLSASVASLILLTVPGDTVERLDLTDFEVQQNGKVGTDFRTPDNLSLSFRFENKGNVQEGPFGKITVKNGDKVVYSDDFNSTDPRDVVLPDSARRWEVPLKNVGKFGHYTVSATLTYGKKNQTIEVSKSFWVIPMQVIVMAVVGGIVLIALLVAFWWFLRSYKRRILRGNHRQTNRR